MQITVQQLSDLLRERGAQNAIVFPNGQVRIVTQWAARNFHLSTETAPAVPQAAVLPAQPQPLNPA
jgi:hypothetical protein